MTSEQFDQLNKTIAESIEKNVNGKIRLLDQKIDNYIREDNEWKNDVKPYIESMRKIQGFSEVGTAILKTVVAIGAAASVMYAGIKWFK